MAWGAIPGELIIVSESFLLMAFSATTCHWWHESSCEEGHLPLRTRYALIKGFVS